MNFGYSCLLKLFLDQPMFLEELIYKNEPLAYDEYFHPFLWNLINF